MRFFPNGPSIPDQLLEQRDKGRVVFLCGAGVSVGAGLPNFSKLTGQLIDFFDPAEGSYLAEKYDWSQNGKFEEKVPLDQIFQLLYQEFGRDEVRGVVAQILASSPGDVSKEHQIIARLSADQERNPQIVTTNFDLLFEQVPGLESLNIHTPPTFPNISVGVPISGITYLHGRLQAEGEGGHEYVLSSSDFGRAYLSEAWATNFMRSLLDQYTVVLVGYQAEDPPIKYLLQGLNHDGSFDRSRLYAFDRGSQEEVDEKWFDRGVTAIAFNHFSDLWQSLEAWAERADNVKAWRSKVVDMSMQGPRALDDYERGQVAHLVRSTAGARAFARADPTPPAEWLCVFDRRYRTQKSRNGVSPSEIYGLDDDDSSFMRRANVGSANGEVLEWCRGDFASHGTYDLVRPWPEHWAELPPRLLNLARWIAEQANSPICLWWIVRQANLNPRLVELLKQKVTRNDGLHSEARRLWELFFQSEPDHSTSVWRARRDCFDLQDKIRRDGWSLSSFRLFREVVAPILICDKPFSSQLPPLETWDDITPSDIARWEVKFPEWHGEKLSVPDESLVHAFEVLEDSLRMAENLLAETDSVFFSKPTCYPNREIEGEFREDHSIFYWFLELFDRLIALLPGNAIARSIVWPTDFSYYFRRLTVYSLNQPSLFSASESFDILQGLIHSGVFWEYEVRREVLFYLNDRWNEFAQEQRSSIAEILIQGPNFNEGEKAHPLEPGNHHGLLYLQWLILRGKRIPKKELKAFRYEVSRVPNWDEKPAKHLTEYDGLLSVNVEVSEDPKSLSELPVSAIAERAESMQRADYFSGLDQRPFDGLVKENPRRALASLSHAAKKGSYPKALWAALLNNWPDAASPRLTDVLVERLRRMPHSSMVELKFPIARWLERWFGCLFLKSNESAWGVLDHFLEAIIDSAGDEGHEAVDHQESRKKSPYVTAINHPVGISVQALLRFALSREQLENGGINEEFNKRFEQLLDAPGKSGASAAAVLAYHISLIYSASPNWVLQHLTPRFEFEHSQCSPSWHGFLNSARIPPKSLMECLKPLFIGLFSRFHAWQWEAGAFRIASQMVVALAVTRQDSEPLLKPREARLCIRSMTDQSRKDAIEYLRRVGAESDGAWLTRVIPFVENVWPKDVRFKTPSATMSWVYLLSESGDSFLPVLRALRKFLVAVEHESHWLYSFSRAARKAPLTMKYPEGVLELLALIIPKRASSAPYELAQVLSLIEEANSDLAGDGRFLRLQSLVEST